jgi:hypothetical protein
VTWAEWFLVAVLVTIGFGIPVLGWVERANRVIDRAKADETMRGEGR